jgi:ABC-type dipeptide/oligopeptide/nickel transport system permease subunit
MALMWLTDLFLSLPGLPLLLLLMYLFRDVLKALVGPQLAVDSKVGEFTEFTVRLPRARRVATAEAAS